MKVAANQIVPPDYYAGVADEFEAIANAIERMSGTNDALVAHLRCLAAELRDGTDWAIAA